MGDTIGFRALPGAWRVVGLLWFVACFNFMARLMITTMHDSVLGAIPMTEAQFGLLTSVFYWVYGLCNPWAGYLSDRFSRSRVIVTSMIAWSAVTLLTGYARSFGVLLVMRALMAVCEAGYMSAALALISEYHRGATRALATGLHMSGAVFGCALAGLGGWLAEVRSWHFAFCLIGTVGIGYGLVLLLALRDAPRDPGRTVVMGPVAPQMGFGRALASLFASRSFLFVLPYVILMGTVSPVIGSWMPTYVREHFHVSQSEAGMSATGYQNIVGLLGLLVAGAWADRWRRGNVRGYLYVCVIGVCLAVPGVALSAKAAGFALAMGGLALYGFGIEFGDATQMPIICQVVDPRFRATAYGTMNFVQQITAGVAIYAAGVLRDLHFDTGNILLATGGIQLLAAGLLLLVRPKEPV